MQFDLWNVMKPDVVLIILSFHAVQKGLNACNRRTKPEMNTKRS